MYFPVSFSRNFSAARRRAISFWRSVSWGVAGLGPEFQLPAAGAGRRDNERRRLGDEQREC